MVAIDLAWTCTGSAGPNSHHLEMVLPHAAVGRHGINYDDKGSVATTTGEESRRTTSNTAANSTTRVKNDTNMWAPYRATGLSIKISAEITPDPIGGRASGGDGNGHDRRPAARGNGGASGNPAASPVPEGTTKNGGSRNLSPRGGGILDIRINNGGSSSTERPKSFPMAQKADKEENGGGDDDDAGSSAPRPHRHQRAESDGPLSPPWRFRYGRSGKKSAEGVHSRGSGLLSDRLLRRSKTVAPTAIEAGGQEEQRAVAGDEADGGRNGSGGRSRVAARVFGMGEGSGETAVGPTRVGRSRTNSMREEVGGAGEGGRGGEEGGGGVSGVEEEIQEASRIQQPLTIHVEDEYDLPGLKDISTTVGVRSSGPASCPSRPCRVGGVSYAGGRGAFNVGYAEVKLPACCNIRYQ